MRDILVETLEELHKAGKLYPPRRWRKDGGGPDYCTGCQTINRHGKYRGPGGIVVWMRNYWRAYAWAANGPRFRESKHRTKIASDAAFERCRLRAMRAVERWLDKWS